MCGDEDGDDGDDDFLVAERKMKNNIHFSGMTRFLARNLGKQICLAGCTMNLREIVSLVLTSEPC